MHGYYEEQGGSSQRVKSGSAVLCKPAILIPDVYAKETKISMSQRHLKPHTYNDMIHKSPEIDGWTKKMWSTYADGCYSFSKSNEILSFTITWIKKWSSSR